MTKISKLTSKVYEHFAFSETVINEEVIYGVLSALQDLGYIVINPEKRYKDAKKIAHEYGFGMKELISILDDGGVLTSPGGVDQMAMHAACEIINSTIVGDA